MTIMTLVMLLPNMAMIISSRKKVGIIMKTLMSSESTMSTLPPRKPAAPPRRMPISAEIREEIRATLSEVLTPAISMLYTS